MGEERPVAAREAGEQPVERAGNPLEERLGDASRWRGADAVAVAGDVLDRHPPVVAGDAHADGAPRRDELAEPCIGRGRAADDARRNLHRGEVADPAQQIVQVLDAVGLPVLAQRLHEAVYPLRVGPVCLRRDSEKALLLDEPTRDRRPLSIELFRCQA